MSDILIESKDIFDEVDKLLENSDYRLKKETLEKIDKKVLFSDVIWNKHWHKIHYAYENEIIKHVPKEWWIDNYNIVWLLIRNDINVFIDNYDVIIKQHDTLERLLEVSEYEFIRYIKPEDFDDSIKNILIYHLKNFY